MDDILAITLQSMHQDMTRMDRVSMNLANAATPGYKRDIVAVRPFGQMIDRLTAATGANNEAATAPSVADNLFVRTDNRPGTLKNTGQALDLALEGPGYFEVQTPQGPAYTRQGSFKVDARGRLVTAQGYPVMGTGGEITLNQIVPVVDSAGRIFDSASATGRSADARPIAQLRIVGMDASEPVQRMGDGFVSATNTRLLDEKDVQLRQGALENSNVTSMQEMVQMLQTMRHFEAMQKVAIGHDDMLGTAIRKLGETN